MKGKGIFLALLLIVLALLVVSGCTIGVENGVLEATRPEWKVGYQWKSTLKPIKEETTTFSEKVVEMEDFEGISCYVVEIKQGNRPWGGRSYYTPDLNSKAFMQHGKIKHRYNPALQRFNWPLIVGKKWEGNYTEVRYTPMGRAEETVVEAKFKVVKIEKVTVPAGEFIAFKITQRIKGRTVQEAWYSPRVKWLVKRRAYFKYKRLAGWIEWELLEYQVE